MKNIYVEEPRISLPSKEQVVGLNKLEVFKKISRGDWKPTDFASYLYIPKGEKYYFIMHPYWATSTIVSRKKYYDRYVKVGGFGFPDFNPKKVYDISLDDSGAIIRPVLYFDTNPLSFLEPIGYKNGIPIVEYGEYPKEYVSEQTSGDLDSLFVHGILETTGRTFTIDYKDIKGEEDIDEYNCYKEYIFQGRKYIRIKRNDGINYEPVYNYYWLEVKPIEWYVDQNTNALISKDGIVSGIPYYEEECKDVTYEETYMNSFLTKHFVKDIVPMDMRVKKKKEKKEKKNKEEEMIEEIISLLDKYPDSEKILNHIEEISTKYNKQLDALKDKKKDNILTTESLESITKSFQIELNTILEDLKKYKAKYEEFFDMIDIINNYIAILECLPIDKRYELSDDFENIYNICFPFLNHEDRNIIKNEFLDVLNETKQEIMNYIYNGDKSEKVNYFTIKEMNLELRKKITPVLHHLKERVSRKDVETEIRKAVKKIIERNYEVPRNRTLSFLLNQINDAYTKLCDLIEFVPDKDKGKYEKAINAIMMRKIDYNQDIINVSGQLKNMWSDLDIIINKIESRNDEMESIEESKIDLDSIKNRI